MYSNPSFDSGEPVEQIVFKLLSLYLYFNEGLSLRRASIYFACAWAVILDRQLRA